MTIEPIEGEPLRYLVQDRRGGRWHLVDLGHDAGACGCEDFEFRSTAAAALGNGPYRCKHVLAARNHLTDEVIASVKTRLDTLSQPD